MFLTLQIALTGLVLALNGVQVQAQTIDIKGQTLDKIAECESGGRQFISEGKVLRGKINKHDVGRFQINEIYHARRAKELGYDIYTSVGNTGYASYLYDQEGTSPWDSSKSCWNRG